MEGMRASHADLKGHHVNRGALFIYISFYKPSQEMTLAEKIKKH